VDRVDEFAASARAIGAIITQGEASPGSGGCQPHREEIAALEQRVLRAAIHRCDAAMICGSG
jgi:hypothetical protein